MKSIEKRVNTDVVDYATDFMSSSLSIGGHGYPSSQRQHLLYMTKNADVAHFKTGGSRLVRDKVRNETRIRS